MKNKIKNMAKWWIYGAIFWSVVTVIWIVTTDMITAANADSWFGWNNVYKWWHTTRMDCIKLNAILCSLENLFFGWLFGWKWQV